MPVLQFKGKTAVENYHHTVPHYRLEFDEKLSVLGRGERPSLDANLIIEGDNLLALKALLPTHAGQIKCIYIDPPYNTGDEGWVYNDNLAQPQFKEWIGRTVGKEGEDACRHDKWCCMMYPRLALLKDLLHPDGAVFISIDDHEFRHLRLILDELWGVEGAIGTLVWQKRYSRDNRPPLNTVHDYIVVCAKNEETFKRNRNKLYPSESQLKVYRNPNNDPRGRWRPIPMTAQGFRENQMYEIETPTGAVHTPPPGRCWSMTEPEYKKLLNEGTSIGKSKRGRIWFGSNGDGQPQEIRYLDEIEGFVPWTWLRHQDVGHTDSAKKELHEIMGEPVATTPKPTKLLRHLLQIYTDPAGNDIVLDSFAGSGTTAHAVLQQNAADDGNRRFVVVQQPYDTKEDESRAVNICRSITAKRITRAIKGYPFDGTKNYVLLEEHITLRSLRHATDLIDRIDSAKSDGESRFDEVKVSCKNGVARVVGVERIKQRAPGLGGTFTYARVGKPLLSEYKDFGDDLPSYEDLAKYIFYTETSREFPGANKRRNPAWNKRSGRIGEHAGRSYYLLYEPSEERDRGLNRAFLSEVASRDPQSELVIYCERLAVHQDELRKFCREHGKRIRHMLVPFQLK